MKFQNHIYRRFEVFGNLDDHTSSNSNSWGLRILNACSTFSSLCINRIFVSFSCCLELTSFLQFILLILLLTDGACALNCLKNQNTLDSIFFGFHQRCKWNKPPSTCDATNSENFFQSSDVKSFSADSDA